MYQRNMVQQVCWGGLATLLIFTAGCGNSSSSSSREASSNSSSVVEQTVLAQQELPVTSDFDDARITEASGMQRSLLIDGVYYVHNDSGNAPLIFATDASGQVIGSIAITGAASIDWEAIGGVRRDGVPGLVIADIGNNGRQRSDLELLVVEEPPLMGLESGFEIAINARRVELSYGDGLAYDAEALFVDGDNDTVVVLTKDTDAASAQSIWKGALSTGLVNGSLILQYSGETGIVSTGFSTAITDVDIHPNGREIAVLTYGALLQGRIHLWAAREGEGTTDALTRMADEIIDVPLSGGNVQAEGISYSPDGNTLLVSAEGRLRSTLTVVVR